MTAWVSFLAVLGASVLWSLIPVLTRFVMHRGDVGPYTLAFWRFALAFVALSAARHARGVGFRTRLWRCPWVIGAGLALALDLVLINYGFRHTPAVVGGLLTNISFPVMMVLGVFVLKERFSLRKAISSALVLCGACLAGTNGLRFVEVLESSRWLGNVLVLGGASMWGVYSMCHKRGARAEAGVTTGLVPILGIGALVVFGPALACERMSIRMSLAGWGSIALLGAGCTGLSYALLARGMRDLDLVTVAIVSAITPGLTVLAAHVFLDEPVEGYALWGLALIVGGILVSARGEPHMKRRLTQKHAEGEEPRIHANGR